MSVRIGDTIDGRYRLRRCLGMGGMGAVFEAEDTLLGRKVAIKTLRSEVAASAGVRERFEREARVASQLDHPGAVRIHEFGEADGTLYLVMQLLSGVVLRDLLDSSAAFEPPRAFRLALQIAETLEHAHRQGVVHRDIKPENILVSDPDGSGERAVLVDFGIAFIFGSERDGRLTRDGTITGTPDYCAPEQARGREVGPPADVYGLGCVLMELLTGNPPFDGEPNEIMARQMFVDAPTLSDRCPEVAWPAGVEGLVSRMLAKDPSVRLSAVDVVRSIGTIEHEWDRRFGARRLSEPRRERMVPSGIPAPPCPRETLRRGTESSPGSETEGSLASNPSGGVAVVGGGPAVREALSVAGVPLATTVEDANLILAIGASDSTIRNLVSRGRPVIAGTVPENHDSLLHLLRLGVYDAIPLTGDGAKQGAAIAARVRRALGLQEAPS